MRLKNSLTRYLSRISIPTAATALILAVPMFGFSAEFIQGIDVYHGDGKVDWATVKKNGIQFAFVKATEGTDFIDKRFDENMKGATAAEVLIGPYHFCRINNDKDGKKFTSYDGEPFTPGTDRYDDAVAEAKAFLKVVLPYYQSGKYLPPVADVEGLPKFGDAKLEKIFISSWMQVFSDEIQKEMGTRPIIYTSKAGAKSRYTPEFAAEQELWLAFWHKSGTDSPPTPDDTPGWKPWLFWQWSATGSVDGVPGSGKKHDCDKDVFRGTQKELEALLIQREN